MAWDVVYFRVPPADRRAIEQAAEEEGVTKSALMRRFTLEGVHEILADEADETENSIK